MGWEPINSDTLYTMKWVVVIPAIGKTNDSRAFQALNTIAKTEKYKRSYNLYLSQLRITHNKKTGFLST